MPVFFPDEAMAILDSLLFVSPEPLSVKILSQLTGVHPDDVKELLNRLKELYDQPGHGLRLVEVAHGYQLVTRPQYHSYIEKLHQEKERTLSLSRAALETLGIIAYCQPVSKAKIEAIRGVRVDHVLANLLERGLIKEVGRSEGPGRPVLYGTTANFLEYFGLKDITDLPPLDSVKV
jgi:segregation and condensation protein B